MTANHRLMCAGVSMHNWLFCKHTAAWKTVLSCMHVVKPNGHGALAIFNVLAICNMLMCSCTGQPVGRQQC